MIPFCLPFFFLEKVFYSNIQIQLVYHITKHVLKHRWISNHVKQTTAQVRDPQDLGFTVVGGNASVNTVHPKEGRHRKRGSQIKE